MSGSDGNRARGITVVGASAGSGKTYRLTQVVSGAIDPAGAEHIGLESLVAVTYTRKAHAELTARIRRTLVSAGAFDEALRLPLAYLGTVHAACLRLLQEFAIDAGLSPNVDVASGDAGKLLRQSLEASLTREAYATLDRLAHRFQLRFDQITKRHEWLGPVSDIMDLARSNRIPATALPAMAERSASSLLKLLPKPESDADALDDALMREIAIASKALANANDGVGPTKVAIELMAAVTRRHRDGEVDWCDWAKLARQQGSKGSKGRTGTDALLVKVREVASRYEAHPRLHAELRELTLAIYDAARVGLSAYQTWKERRRVVDYVDMLDRALTLVAHDRVADVLRERLKLAVVDEFQDTSPIQLALFMKLHLLAKRSVWVGDRKQCIFEYAGADPMLMDSVASWVTESSGQRDVLNVNFRSRPELVEACSELFAAALSRHEFSRDEVVVTAARTTPPALAVLPPFGVWAIEAKNVEDQGSSLASGVARMLTDASSTPVVDRTTNEVRAVRPGDIAVLVATNAEARLLADALHARGIRSAIARPGLLKTPEGVLVDAALRWLLDEGDTLAAATIDALLGFGGQAPDAWLDGLLPRAVAGAPAAPALRESAWRTSLGPVRARLGMLSPSEALDEVLASLDVVHLCARWPDAPQRVANLDALRGIASGYEDRCHQEREAGTVAGLLRYFDDMAAEKLRRDEVIASDDQHVPTDDGAVVVSTYHRAKGLEWPVVVLSSLDKAERRTAWEVCPESDRGASFDPEDPLAGRWIRYWPKPLGTLKTVPLLEAAEQSPEGVRVAKREEKERARLLYVGFTRARDHLVLAVRVATSTTKATKKTEAVVVTKASCQWLDALADDAGEALLGLPVEAADGATDAVVRVRTGKGSGAGKSHEVAARVWRLNAAAPVVPAAEAVAERRWFARGVAASSVAAARYRINPSNAAVDWPDLVLPTIGEIVTLPAAMAIDGTVAQYNVLGDAVHAFFAADVEGLPAEARVERARRLLAAAGLVGTLSAEALVEASDRLRAFVEQRWPGAIWHREVAIDAQVSTSSGERRVAGIIDLLLETAQGYVIFDHKTFPAKSEAAWRAKAVEFVPQFAAYDAALQQLDVLPVLESWIHLPAAGALVALRREARATDAR
jgi:ATP-dependent helicase/nuclease subunit A